MAISLDSVTQTTLTANGSFNHTCGANASLLCVIIQLRTASSSDGASATYNGSPLSTAVSVDFASGGSKKAWILYIPNPATGSNTVAITFTSTAESVVTAISFNGTDRSSPIGATGSNTTSGATSLTTNITTTAANSWILDALNEGGSTPFTPGGSQTQRWGAATTINGMTGYGSTKPTTTAGANSTSWSFNSSAMACLINCEIKAANNNSGFFLAA